jgi:succinate dehydrogenase / fumarate reductase, iron-sulfur subunit
MTVVVADTAEGQIVLDTRAALRVCPEEIHITDNAIPLKERGVDKYYDSLRRLFRMFK